MSLYSEYLTEKTNDKIIETEHGFATYRHIPDQKSTYIIDIYVVPRMRKEYIASEMASMIEKEARMLGHTTLLGSVVPSTKNSDTSIKVLQAYGMRLKSAANDFIVFEKEI